jgi:hypothetical protein
MSDQFIVALCAWRENRGGGIPGMQSVINCIANRMKARSETGYEVVTLPFQFSSMTAPGDPQLDLYPRRLKPGWTEWLAAQQLAEEALNGTLEDITDGATSYYALSMAKPPWWAPSMTPTVVIEGQQFLK